jgi:hypothetical protein
MGQWHRSIFLCPGGGFKDRNNPCKVREMNNLLGNGRQLGLVRLDSGVCGVNVDNPDLEIPKKEGRRVDRISMFSAGGLVFLFPW